MNCTAYCMTSVHIVPAAMSKYYLAITLLIIPDYYD